MIMDIAHQVNLATISSIWLVLVGFLFISYEFLGRPAGFLRWLMRVIVSSLIIPVPCLLLAFFTPASYSLWSFNFREIVIRFAFYGGLVGGFYGLFTHSYDVRKQQPQQQQLFDIRSLNKGMPWRKRVYSFLSDRPSLWIGVDSFIGFVFASLYWCFSTYAVLFISNISPTNLLLGYVRVAGMGIIGGAYWRLLHQSSLSPTTNKPSTFSLQGYLRGAMYWFVACFILYLLSALLFAIIWHKPVEVSNTLLLGTMGLVIVGGLLSGCSQSFMCTVGSSNSRNRLKTLLFWSFMWVGLWVVAVMIFQTEMAIIPKQIYLPTSFSLTQVYFLFGTILTILTGVIMMLIIKTNMWLAYIYHLISLNMLSFSLISRRRNTFLNSTRKHFRWIAESSGGKPPLFSVRDSLIGLVFWPATWLAGNVIGWLLATSRSFHSSLHSPLLDISLGLPQSDMIAEIQPDVIARIVAIPIAGIVAGGLSRFICWKILNMRGERQLGTFGAIITIVGFMFQLVEPIQHLSVVHLEHGHNGPLLAVAWSANGRQIASASSGTSDTTIQVWNSSTGKTDVVYRLYTSPVTAVTWSPNKKYIASSSSTQLDIWDAANGHDIRTLSTNTAPITSMAWSPDGRYLAYSIKRISTSGKVLIWDSWKPDVYAELTPKRHAGSVNKVAWSPNGKFIAAADEDGTVLVWDKVSKKNISTYHGHAGRVNALAWSPDGKCIASAGQDGTVRVWDATTEENVFVYHKHTAPVNDVVWSPNGKRIASAGDDRTAQVWDAVDGKNVIVYRGHDAPVRSIAWSPAPGSSHIATASDDQTVQIWDSFSGNHLYTYDASGSE
jgi:hypothetical protein